MKLKFFDRLGFRFANVSAPQHEQAKQESAEEEKEETPAPPLPAPPFPNRRQDDLKSVEPPRGVRLNKNLIVMIAVGAAAIFVLAFLSYAQEQNAPREKDSGGGEQWHKRESSVLKDLPDTYGDAGDAKQAGNKAAPASAVQAPNLPSQQRASASLRVPSPTPPRIPAQSGADRSSGFSSRQDDQEMKRSLSSKITVVSRTSAGQTPVSPQTPAQPPVSAQQPENGDPNGQAEKSRFLQSASMSFYSKHSVEEAKSGYELKAGSLIPCLLQTAVNSDLPGVVTAKVSENVYDTQTGNFLLIPAGTTVIGRYDSQVNYGQNRVLLVWQRLVFPDGSSVGLGNLTGVDGIGQAGVRDGVDRHSPDLVRGVVLSGLLAAVSAVATGNSGDDDSYQAEAGRGAAESILDLGNEMTRQNLKRPPTLTVRPGFRFHILVHEDLALKRFQD